MVNVLNIEPFFECIDLISSPSLNCYFNEIKKIRIEKEEDNCYSIFYEIKDQNFVLKDLKTFDTYCNAKEYIYKKFKLNFNNNEIKKNEIYNEITKKIK